MLNTKSLCFQLLFCRSCRWILISNAATKSIRSMSHLYCSDTLAVNSPPGLVVSRQALVKLLHMCSMISAFMLKWSALSLMPVSLADMFFAYELKKFFPDWHAYPNIFPVKRSLVALLINDSHRRQNRGRCKKQFALVITLMHLDYHLVHDNCSLHHLFHSFPCSINDKGGATCALVPLANQTTSQRLFWPTPAL